ncbi:sulfotransferase family protein [Thioclava electrotropha]|uniref:Sulfotransferase family 2 domain-containing protein n=1 Tax=Thioclava electrotropha TaxID=1549850 RepID=A0ABX6YQY6_9RHOB|nr:sulfotransferase family protein [Thioclava electrotropha]QPZ89698.1 sulfotransferase family 2 domain-containing protein [Thioclava electrotropha]
MLDHMASVERPNVVFTKNSKAACTSISHAIFKLTTGLQYQGLIHQEAEVLTQGREHWDTNIARLASPSFKSFTFVRHPVDRIESAFRDFVTERRNPSHFYHIEKLRRFGCVEGRSERDNFAAFLEYVQACHETCRLRTDRHWRRQVDNIGWGHFQYDYIGKVETLAEDLKAILIMAGVDQGAAERVSALRKNSSRTSKRIATPSQISTIRSLYAEDFEAFGYD